MAATLIQSLTGSSGGAVASFSLTFPNPVNPGNCLVATCTSGSGSKTFTVSDTVNGSWGGAEAGYSSGTNWLFALPATAVGTPQVTATISASAGIQLCIMEWNGLLGTVDQSATHSGAAATSSTVGPTSTLTNTGEIAIATCQLAVSSAGWVTPAGYTLLTPTTSSFGVAWLAVSGTSAQSPSFTWTTSTNYSSIVATLNPGNANASVDTLLGQGWV